MPTVFQSADHPGHTPGRVVYTRALAGPLAVCTVPLMIGATTSALLGEPVWGYLVWGLPAALTLSSLWTHFTLARTPAELAVRPGQAALRSVVEVLRNSPRTWHAISSVRATRWELELSIGRTTHMLKPNRWPQYAALREETRNAFDPSRQPSAGKS